MFPIPFASLRHPRNNRQVGSAWNTSNWNASKPKNASPSCDLTQVPPPNGPEKPKPISPNSNRLIKELGSFLHIAQFRTRLAASPCRRVYP
jgi:hypothetical protein